MWYIAIGIFVFHSILAIVDEVYYHYKRGLGLWERIGHPADTATVLFCYSVVWVLTPTTRNIIIYVLLAAFSCLFVTKDEFVHSKLCVRGEMWLHALLFLLHPILFIIVGFFWVANANTNHPFWQSLQDDSLAIFRMFFLGQSILTLLMMFYQISYWNLWKNPKSIQ